MMIKKFSNFAIARYNAKPADEKQQKIFDRVYHCWNSNLQIQ